MGLRQTVYRRNMQLLYNVQIVIQKEYLKALFQFLTFQYPYVAMQALYFSTKDLQSAAGSSALEKSMHSSRCCFSSLHTQQGCPTCVSIVFIVAGSHLGRWAHLGLGLSVLVRCWRSGGCSWIRSALCAARSFAGCETYALARKPWYPCWAWTVMNPLSRKCVLLPSRKCHEVDVEVWVIRAYRLRDDSEHF